eukprot:GEMP01112755.1.p1 GENE.GEMP01112755.1~~GEMP01112755.1.p1  ORF type:complete len:101 (-),score=2.68 GEMP01112755.1:265-567(-)
MRGGGKKIAAACHKMQIRFFYELMRRADTSIFPFRDFFKKGKVSTPKCTHAFSFRFAAPSTAFCCCCCLFIGTLSNKNKIEDKSKNTKMLCSSIAMYLDG